MEVVGCGKKHVRTSLTKPAQPIETYQSVKVCLAGNTERHTFIHKNNK